MLDSAVQPKTSSPGSPMKKAILAVVTLCFCAASFAASTITTRVEDPTAIYLDAPATGGDSSTALQAAIDKASVTLRDGIGFVPARRHHMYRIESVWSGMRGAASISSTTG